MHNRKSDTSYFGKTNYIPGYYYDIRGIIRGSVNK